MSRKRKAGIDDSQIINFLDEYDDIASDDGDNSDGDSDGSDKISVAGDEEDEEEEDQVLETEEVFVLAEPPLSPGSVDMFDCRLQPGGTSGEDQVYGEPVLTPPPQSPGAVDLSVDFGQGSLCQSGPSGEPEVQPALAAPPLSRKVDVLVADIDQLQRWAKFLLSYLPILTPIFRLYLSVSVKDFNSKKMALSFENVVFFETDPVFFFLAR
jgi:hypothetical protein